MAKLKETRLFRNFRSKYRLLIQDENNFEEKFSVRLSRANVLALVSAVFLATASLVVLIVVFTPLKEFIPGYPDLTIKSTAIDASLKLDSLERKLAMQENYLNNIKKILNDELSADSAFLVVDNTINPNSVVFTRSVEDSLLRLKMETELEYSLAFSRNQENQRSNDLGTTVFFPPIRGTVTAEFDPLNEHYGIDIVTTKDAPIKATLAGIVVLSAFTSDAGNVIQIQHENELISVYKHNAILFKRQGESVKAGETIAIVGNSGEFTSGPHLHFELWYKGKPVDPSLYMVFE